ncbi:MAG TPA: hypothetical protein VI094_01030 [Propionibacteriaceae bacterium]
MAEGDGDAAGSNAELKSGTGPGQIGKESNGWLDDRGLEQLRPERLVSLGYPLIEVGLRHGESINQVELALAYIEC